MKYDHEKTAEIIKDFRDLVMEIKTINSACEAEIKEADMAFCDIRHKCEINYPTSRSERTKICQMINQYSVSRRNAKETLEVIAPLIQFLGKHPSISSAIGQLSNETRKSLENTRRSKTYRPRVLPELFE